MQDEDRIVKCTCGATKPGGKFKSMSGHASGCACDVAYYERKAEESRLAAEEADSKRDRDIVNLRNANGKRRWKYHSILVVCHDVHSFTTGSAGSIETKKLKRWVRWLEWRLDNWIPGKHFSTFDDCVRILIVATVSEHYAWELRNG